MKRLFFILLLFQTMTSMGQSIDVETEKHPGVKKMKVQLFRGPHNKKIYRDVYYFDDIGNAVKSSHYFKIKHVSSYKYLYNDKGLLLEKIQTYDVDHKNRTDTTRYTFTYEFDTNGRLTRKTTYGINHWDTYYQDFDKNNNPQTVFYPSNKQTIKRKYNSSNQVILIQDIDNNAIRQIEEFRYNEFGDNVYYKIQVFFGKKPNDFLVETGITVVKIYEYKYDKLNRWIKKYVVYDNKKVILEKRIFK